MRPKHSFRWPRIYRVNEMPHNGCVVLRGGEPGKVGSWLALQNHLPHTLSCGCTVCRLCAQLLMFNVRSRVDPRDGAGWSTYDERWLALYHA